MDLPTPEDDLQEARDTLEKEKERLQALRLQLARKNRAIVSIERQLDNIPDRTELAQYQRRFIELYVQGGVSFRLPAPPQIHQNIYHFIPTCS